MLKRNPAIGDIWKRMIARHNPDFLLGMMAERMKSSLDDDRRERLKEIKQPTLVIAGERDRRLIDASRHLAREIPKAQLAIIHGAGHMANLEAPEEFEKIVLGFLAGN
jgi:pimeloyl-ACP methyl ester carboxylesterase